MKNVTLIIILITYYLFGALMHDVISETGFLLALILFIISIIVISLIIKRHKKKNNSEVSSWELFKYWFPSTMGIELILLFLLRLFIFLQI